MKSSDSIRKYGLWGVRGILALLFVVSGTGKLIDGKSTAHLVELVFEETPTIATWADALVVLVSGTELLLAGALTWGRWLEWALWSSFGMIAGFTAALVTLLKGVNVASCGCFGAFDLGLSLEVTILRNFFLLTLILGGILLADTKSKTESHGVRSEAEPYEQIS